jgi:TonB family protein
MRTLKTIIVLFVASVACAQGIWHSLDFAVAVRGLQTETRIKELITPIALPMPGYPLDLARAGISGDANVRFLVKGDGSVGEIHVLAASQSEFRAVVSEAIARWRFQAYTPDGKQKVEKAVWMKCRILFRREEE